MTVNTRLTRVVVTASCLLSLNFDFFHVIHSIKTSDFNLEILTQIGNLKTMFYGIGDDVSYKKKQLQSLSFTQNLNRTGIVVCSIVNVMHHLRHHQLYNDSVEPFGC